MELSCFASESCNRGETAMHFDLADFLPQDIRLICVGGGEFLGCLSAQRCETATSMQILFPRHRPPRGSVLVSNLCVDPSSRKQGVVRKLLDEVMRGRATVYVLVAKERAHDPTVRSFMERRSRNLVDMYTHLGFSPVDDSADFYLMAKSVSSP
jgi:ribosomal protein S18 acetylase RimI-like enzyme